MLRLRDKWKGFSTAHGYVWAWGLRPKAFSIWVGMMGPAKWDGFKGLSYEGLWFHLVLQPAGRANTARKPAVSSNRQCGSFFSDDDREHPVVSGVGNRVCHRASIGASRSSVGWRLQTPRLTAQNAYRRLSRQRDGGCRTVINFNGDGVDCSHPNGHSLLEFEGMV